MRVEEQDRKRRSLSDAHFAVTNVTRIVTSFKLVASVTLPIRLTTQRPRGGDTMAIMDDSYERDMMKIWTLVVDLSEQLSHTKQQADALRSHSMILKVCVILKNQTLPQFLTVLVNQSGSSSAFRDGVCSETVLLRACSPRLVLTRLCYQGLIFICHKVRLCSLTMRILLRTTYRRI